jgi:hypothetical protein
MHPIFVWAIKNTWLLLLICLAGTAPALLSGQSVTGNWQGVIYQPDTEQTYRYTVILDQDGSGVSGRAVVTGESANERAEFLVSGTYDGKRLRLQEIEQLYPADTPWCLKFLQLALAEEQLSGDWTARGCQPGTAVLTRVGGGARFAQSYPYGRWAGELQQADRDYGFFFELDLAADGTGRSHIVSEANGGEAFHRLRWQRQPTTGEVTIREDSVVRQTDPAWRWCIKTLQLQPDTTATTRRLHGSWSGHIETTTGACAPGTVFLEQFPTLRDTLVPTNFIADRYQARTGRRVHVDRLIKVRSDRVHIRVWDAGTVDGDVATVFLNGERILHQYRATKRRPGIPVRVRPGENLLILHAEDLGDIVPNTVAVGIDDGFELQTVILNANLSRSGAILIQPFARE